MWFFVGTKDKTELVPGGRRANGTCAKCGEHVTFYERKIVSTLELYFIPVVDYRTRQVMACGACGALFATDEQESTASSEKPFITQMEKAGETIASTAKSTFDKIRDEVRRIASEVPPPPAPLRSAEPTASDDPLADDEQALEAKFKDLEKRMRVSDK